MDDERKHTSEFDRAGMNEREFWLLIRRALLIIVEAIERRYLQKCTVDKIQ